MIFDVLPLTHYLYDYSSYLFEIKQCSNLRFVELMSCIKGIENFTLESLPIPYNVNLF